MYIRLRFTFFFLDQMLNIITKFQICDRNYKKTRNGMHKSKLNNMSEKRHCNEAITE